MTLDAVVTGLAENPAVPVDELLRRRPEAAAEGLRRRAVLPLPVQEAMAAHPHWRVRSVLARHRDADPGMRARLSRDPVWRVRFAALGRRGQRPLAEPDMIRLMTELCAPSIDMRASTEELFEELFETDRELIVFAARHPDPRVRRVAAPYTWWRDELRPLLTDSDPEVARAAAAAVAEHERVMQPADLPPQHCHAFWRTLHRPLSRALAEQVIASGDVDAIRSMAANPTLPADLVDTLAQHPDTGIRVLTAYREGSPTSLASDAEPEVRAASAARRDLPPSLTALLAADADARVRAVIAARAGLSEQLRARLAADPDPGVREAAVRDALLDGPVADLARAEFAALRRRAAQRPDLPLDLVAALAHDADDGVRLELALNHPDAPAELLLRCYLEDPSRDQLTTLPGLPVAGLARFAGHADPRVRWLATLDPEADPSVLDRLTRDEDGRVRLAAARSPRLPAARIVALLDNPELALHAAANPAIDPVAALARVPEPERPPSAASRRPTPDI